MSDFPYPKRTGDWKSIGVSDNRFPEQIRTGTDPRVVETIFNPHKVIENHSSVPNDSTDEELDRLPKLLGA